QIEIELLGLGLHRLRPRSEHGGARPPPLQPGVFGSIVPCESAIDDATVPVVPGLNRGEQRLNVRVGPETADKHACLVVVARATRREVARAHDSQSGSASQPDEDLRMENTVAAG